ncbi:hypothetical protein FQN54_005533 [Arachnomyces sp. PD_36]|nr:hypothetical protein FQN54_005533 [Arachnomyces sp. PD_36]
MSSILRWSRSLLPRSGSPTRQFPTSGFHTFSATEKIEEEGFAWYSADTFYPVRIGEVFHSKYQVLGKLGYGAYSTVWLCRDLQGHRHVAMKVYERNSAQGQRELDIYNHLNSITTANVGATLVRTALDDFEISAPTGKHLCLIHQPLGMRLADLKARASGRKLPEELLKLTLIHILHALDFLHTEAKIVHTDIQDKNILLGVEDESIFSSFEKSELENPSARKIDGDRVIYKSRELQIPKVHGRPVLCDFGEARTGSDSYHEDIQPYLYRAPEVLLRMRWDHKVDIWNVGVLIWDIFENMHLFDARDENKENSNLHHLAEMVALLGSPPNDFLRKSDYAPEFFDDQGNWRNAIPIPSISLEKLELNLSGSNKDLFLQFVRKMLQWTPEARQSAKELLDDPWLRSS